MELPYNNNQPYASSIPEGDYGAQLKIRPNGQTAVELLRVPDRTDILIHPANKPSQLKGCIAPGKTAGDDSVGSSGAAAMKEILDIINQTRQVDMATGDVTDIVVRIRH